MALVYKNCIPTTGNPAYACDPCSDGEKGRVSGVVLFDKSIKDDLTQANLILMSWWEAQLAASTVRIIPSVRGTYDGGTNKTVTGFGRLAEKITGKEHVLVWNDKNHTTNHAFYSYLEENLKNFIPGWVTENELRIANAPLTKFEVKDPVEEDVDSIVVWQSTATWTQKNPNIPQIFDLTEHDDVKELFDNCIDTTPVAP
ncbi:hypothetical protein DSECCO2_595210 [anaerobic digester metagenome]